MKDMPAMVAEPGSVTISSSLTADVGTDFLNVLDTTQKALITGLVDIQRDDLYEIVTTRRAISTQLRRFITLRMNNYFVSIIEKNSGVNPPS